MLTARAYHSATLLPNGKVLVAGGYKGNGYYDTESFNTTELYDPATGTWSTAAPLITPRDKHSALLLPDGRVLVVGGESTTSPGGIQQRTFPTAAEIYTPATNSWESIDALRKGRIAPGLVYLTRGPNAGKVLVVNGCVDNPCTVEILDLASHTTIPAASTIRTYNTVGFSALMLTDGRVFVIDSGASAGEVYDSTTNNWTSTPSLENAYNAHPPTLLADGRVLTGSGDLYDPAANSWTHTGGRTNTTGCGGGVGISVSAGVAVFTKGCRYDVAGDAWSQLPSQPIGYDAGGPGVVRLGDGRILVTGGDIGNNTRTPINNAILYNDTPFKVALSFTPGGVASVTPTGPFTGGGNAVLTASPASGYLFTGWIIDGQSASYANPLSININGRNYAVVATFAQQPIFSDVSAGIPGAEAIAQLAARGIIKGYQDGRFGPDDHTLRAQMAALICRAVGWDTEAYTTPFSDRNGVDDDLWRNIGTLSYHNVARGYNSSTYGTTDNVLNVQVIAFISRAMVAKGYWQQQSADSTSYPNVPSSSGHRDDLATYVHYAGTLPDFPDTSGAFANYDQPSTRAWFARILWQALSSYFATNRVP